MSARPRIRMLGVVVAMLGPGTACTDARGIINDDFGIAGYARLQGTVTRADGSAFAGGTLYWSCGDPEPTWFGHQATTSPTGAFDIAVDARPAGSLPASGQLVCEVRAVSGPTVVASGRARVQFSQDSVQRPTTQFALVEGQGSP